MDPIKRKASLDPLARALALSSSLVVGCVMPVMMALSSKSSPLFFAIATGLSVAAALAAGHRGTVTDQLHRMMGAPAFLVAAGLVAFMLVSVAWAHDPSASALQFLQFSSSVMLALLLALTFPLIAPVDRVLWWVLAAVAAALIMIIDINTGLTLRKVTGGLPVSYRYNRTIVTLMVLIWPLLALIVVRQKFWLLLVILPLTLAVFAGESASAVLALAIGIIVFPLAWFAPRLSCFAGLAALLFALAMSPIASNLARALIGETSHKALADAHAGERLAIWRSFEAASQKQWLRGNGFGSSLNLHQAPVAKEIAPDVGRMLTEGHPHNAFLQLWVEMGALGAGLAASLFVFLFRAIGKASAGLQPFLLTWVAVVTGVALVSHGAWQPWWWAAIGASVVMFITLQREMTDTRL